jgi:hypothetical protein
LQGHRFKLLPYYKVLAADYGWKLEITVLSFGASVNVRPNRQPCQRPALIDTGPASQLRLANGGSLMMRISRKTQCRALVMPLGR